MAKRARFADNSNMRRRVLATPKLNERELRVRALHERRGACPACGGPAPRLIGECELRPLRGGRVRCVALACIVDECRLVVLAPIGLPITCTLLDQGTLTAPDPIAELVRVRPAVVSAIRPAARQGRQSRRAGRRAPATR